MRNTRLLPVCVALCSLYLFACDSGISEENIASPARDLLSAAVIPPCTVESGGVLVRNYIVCLEDVAVLDDLEGSVTRFTYVVSGTGTSPELSHFVIGIDTCEPVLNLVDSSSGGILGTDPTTGVTGVKWDQKVGKNASATFHVTFEGELEENITTAAVKSGRGFAVENVPGAGCAADPVQTFDISGAVFIDADASQSRSVDELGIADVTVELVDVVGNVVGATMSASDGSYAFDDVPSGPYTVRIPFATVATDFNEQLGAYFIATTSASLAVLLTGDSSGNDFGFDVDADVLAGSFENGTLTSTAEDTKFWREQFKKALSGGGTQNGAAVSKEELQRLLDLIEGELQEPGINTFLPEPFLFGEPGNAGDEDLKIALDILNPPKNRNDPHLDFVTALLMAELNYVSGRDIHDAPGLLEAILSWAEALYTAEFSASKRLDVQASLRDGTRVLNAYGGSGGVDN